VGLRSGLPGKVCHYQALARFAGPQDSDETAKFTEALGIANISDLAVANKVLSLIEQQTGHLAFTISGASIAAPASFGMLAAILAKRRKLAPRTLIGITEVDAIDDLQNADHAIAALRTMGYRVGLEDFGTGAASVSFLQALPVDFVSFDGALIQKIGSAKRDDGLLSGLAKLCGEMGVITIVAGIESEAMAKSVRAMGFHQGSGKWLGAPLKEIPAAPVAVGKRQGVKESWS
jgi:EAL domain-containing protein (putative c-di-GMP-specific phosphodiesterase class I)